MFGHRFQSKGLLSKRGVANEPRRRRYPKGKGRIQ
jgi:hypothetical protein